MDDQNKNSSSFSDVSSQGPIQDVSPTIQSALNQPVQPVLRERDLEKEALRQPLPQQPVPVQYKSPHLLKGWMRRWLPRIGVVLLVATIVTTITVVQSNRSKRNSADSFPPSAPTLTNSESLQGTLQLSQDKQLNVNAQLRANNSLVISPTTRPENPVIVQVY